MGEVYPAVVDRVILNGKHGPYAVALSESLGMITFSLSAHVWREESYPETGVWVVLYDLRKKRAGWRAQQGRYLRPSDEQREVHSNE